MHSNQSFILMMISILVIGVLAQKMVGRYFNEDKEREELYSMFSSDEMVDQAVTFTDEDFPIYEENSVSQSSTHLSTEEQKMMLLKEQALIAQQIAETNQEILEMGESGDYSLRYELLQDQLKVLMRKRKKNQEKIQELNRDREAEMKDSLQKVRDMVEMNKRRQEENRQLLKDQKQRNKEQMEMMRQRMEDQQQRMRDMQQMR